MTSFIQLVNGGTIAAIGVVVFLIIWALKGTKFNNQYLPIAAELIGAVIGIFIALAMADTSWIVGMVDGLVAGAVSVGGNELIKSILTTFTTDEGAK
ncbi:phage lysis protein [Lactiplantibacillus fabifermentans T30PCM01]|uniref:Phage lysis protein n=1 Tax=Lactiplantibacillus fabifermentans T30PCM01 TaxID=1400520 RepID=W6T8K8_9LACO|nr:lysis protein [Lactiplantibacillus fabifermentans]ETY74766.1 phage lysis protein [Lactiplantibacillus fabifermentans T30PCM01]